MPKPHSLRDESQGGYLLVLIKHEDLTSSIVKLNKLIYNLVIVHKIIFCHQIAQLLSE